MRKFFAARDAAKAGGIRRKAGAVASVTITERV